MAVQIHDPLALPDKMLHEYGIRITPFGDLAPADAVVVAVAHAEYARGGWPMVQRLLKGGGGTVLDVRAMLERAEL